MILLLQPRLLPMIVQEPLMKLLVLIKLYALLILSLLSAVYLVYFHRLFKVANCDFKESVIHLLLLKHEILWESVNVSFHLLIQSFDIIAINSCQIFIQHYLLPSNYVHFTTNTICSNQFLCFFHFSPTKPIIISGILIFQFHLTKSQIVTPRVFNQSAVNFP